ncbi:hypothetical protein AZE42_09727 [Rhizopogon vesiculosus]|uniref:Uncharacterized protein n=1 Tax=Rhizopogon vesiculosus TaxID=180088 RepID=A0A1J8QIL2_9AGAM|nr:hypothetical protein AZE42_09727 [Rhizopogon vesiculosus]
MPTTILRTCSASCSHACCKNTDQTTLPLPMAQKWVKVPLETR